MALVSITRCSVTHRVHSRLFLHKGPSLLSQRASIYSLIPVSKFAVSSYTYSRTRSTQRLKRNSHQHHDYSKGKSKPLSTTHVLRRDVPLTSVQYPALSPGDFNHVNADDVAFFESLLPGRVVTSSEDLEMANTDWLGIYKGQSKLLLKPKTTDEVSGILRYCNMHNLAVVPQGGNTGLVGGGVPVFDEIIISTALMNKIMDFNQLSGILTCQAGCILENLDQFVHQYGYTMPLDLGAKSSCHIGGNVATNAGGIRLLRYGSLHGSVLGVEAVLANGEVFDGLTPLRKDNTGYDLKQLLIGSEGTLGLITGVCLLCPPKPQSVNLALLGCDNFEAVLETYRLSKKMLGEILSAFELIDAEAMQIQTTYGGHKNPLEGCPYSFYVVVETSGSDENHDQEKMTNFLEKAMSKEYVKDGTIATDSAKLQKMWQLRESIPLGLSKAGVTYKYDLSFSIEEFYKPTEVMRKRLAGKVLHVCGYGHLGDGNLHLNVICQELSKENLAMIEPYIFELVTSMGGSISAEHGLGLKKRNVIGYSRSKQQIKMMQQVKRVFDPDGILNPYKTIPSD